ncbi:MAG TPA: SRPBCC domain-containing protein [Myxococcota bacterium]|nr:SRPBCC domain-containing protein [Myxococcota bacterium]
MSLPALVLEVEIKSTPEKIWEAITSPDWTRRYFFDSAVRSEFRRGAKIEWNGTSGNTMADGEIVEIDPPWKLVTTWRSLWQPELAPEPASRVTWEIEERANGCLLRVTHDRLDASPKTRAAVTPGWRRILDGLRDCVQAG